jgi:hypothetical protein
MSKSLAKIKLKMLEESVMKMSSILMPKKSSFWADNKELDSKEGAFSY